VNEQRAEVSVVTLVVVIVFGVLLLWWVGARAQVREAEQVEVNTRERVAFLLADEMREWDAHGVPPPECLRRGVKWVLERAATAAPLLAQMVAKAAYMPVLRNKIVSRIGVERTQRLLEQIQVDIFTFDQKYPRSAPLERWWNDVDRTFERLLEVGDELGVPLPQLPESSLDSGPRTYADAVRRILRSTAPEKRGAPAEAEAERDLPASDEEDELTRYLLVEGPPVIWEVHRGLSRLVARCRKRNAIFGPIQEPSNVSDEHLAMSIRAAMNGDLWECIATYEAASPDEESRREGLAELAAELQAAFSLSLSGVPPAPGKERELALFLIPFRLVFRERPFDDDL
jgi:hypothetical protein